MVAPGAGVLPNSNCIVTIEHVLDVGLGQSTDTQIWRYAELTSRSFVTVGVAWAVPNARHFLGHASIQ
jgi:hypothetical protein